MKILFLGPSSKALFDFLSALGEEILSTEEALPAHSHFLRNADFLVSYGYRHILKRDVLDLFPMRAINLHISLLPWNKGADPNLWSFLEDTPKGVTIHFMDHGLDTGDILVQREVDYSRHDTLRSSYERLRQNVEELFKEFWKDIRMGRIPGKPQREGGTFHRKSDSSAFQHLLLKGWDTPVFDLIGKAAHREIRSHED